jgi:hypothetical protein
LVKFKRCPIYWGLWPHSHAYPDGDADAHPDPNAHTVGDSNAHRHPNPYAYPDGDTDAHILSYLFAISSKELFSRIKI